MAEKLPDEKTLARMGRADLLVLVERVRAELTKLRELEREVRRFYAGAGPFEGLDHYGVPSALVDLDIVRARAG